jgi:hypothetical protein
MKGMDKYTDLDYNNFESLNEDEKVHCLLISFVAGDSSKYIHILENTSMRNKFIDIIVKEFLRVSSDEYVLMYIPPRPTDKMGSDGMCVEKCKYILHILSCCMRRYYHKVVDDILLLLSNLERSWIISQLCGGACQLPIIAPIVEEQMVKNNFAHYVETCGTNYEIILHAIRQFKMPSISPCYPGTEHFTEGEAITSVLTEPIHRNRVFDTGKMKLKIIYFVAYMYKNDNKYIHYLDDCDFETYFLSKIKIGYNYNNENKWRMYSKPLNTFMYTYTIILVKKYLHTCLINNRMTNIKNMLNHLPKHFINHILYDGWANSTLRLVPTEQPYV